MKEFVVYWLYDAYCEAPERDGYVGVTGDFDYRIKSHRRKRQSSFDVKVLFTGTEDECYALERELRPKQGIGWNAAIGGPDGYKRGHFANRGKRRTQEQIERLRQAYLGYKMPAEQRAKISAALKGRNPEAATQASTLAWKNGTRVSGMTGQKHGAETRAKMSAARSAFYANGGTTPGFRGKHTEETKAKLRAARFEQIDPRLGKKHSAEAKAKMSAAWQNRNPMEHDLLGRFVPAV